MRKYESIPPNTDRTSVPRAPEALPKVQSGSYWTPRLANDGFFNVVEVAS